MAGIAVDLDRKPEGVEDCAAQFRLRLDECLSEIGNALQHALRILEIHRPGIARFKFKLAEDRLRFCSLAFQRLDSLADEMRIDASLDRGELARDSALNIGQLVRQPFTLGAIVRLKLLGEHSALRAEVAEPVRAEDASSEEGVNDFQQSVLAHVLPFAVPDRLGRLVAVADPVVAGHVGDALPGLAVHPKRVVSGGAVDDSPQQVEAFLLAAAPRSLTAPALANLGLHSFKNLIGDKRRMAALCLDPFLAFPANQRTFALLNPAKIKSVPVEPARIDGVLEDRAEGVLRPFASGVAL